MATLLRLRRAWKYAFGDLSTADAKAIISECRRAAGQHPLLVLSVDDALEHMRATHADHPELPRLVARACREIERRCDHAWEDVRHANIWAAKLARGYAADEGLVLTQLDDGKRIEVVAPSTQDSESDQAPPLEPHSVGHFALKGRVARAERRRQKPKIHKKRPSRMPLRRRKGES